MKKIIILFFALLFLIVLGIEVSAIGCCLERDLGGGVKGFCEPVNSQTECNGDFNVNPCSSFPECTKGCCFVAGTEDEENRGFYSAKSGKECDYLGGELDVSNSDCSVTEGYQYGCCNIGNIKCSVVQEAECKFLGEGFGISEPDFNTDVTDPVECVNECYSGETGCCYIPSDCKNGITLGECEDAGGEFRSGQLCSLVEECGCDTGTKKICKDDDIWLADMCNNPIEVVDSGNCVDRRNTCGCEEYDNWELCEQNALKCVPSSCSVDIVFGDFGRVKENNVVKGDGEAWCNYMMDVNVDPGYYDTSGMVMANLNLIYSSNEEAYENLLSELQGLVSREEISESTVQGLVSNGREDQPSFSWVDVFPAKLSKPGVAPAFEYGRNHAVMTCDKGEIKVLKQCEANRNEICISSDEGSKCIKNDHVNCYGAKSEEECKNAADCEWIDKWVLDTSYSPEGVESDEIMETYREQLSLGEKVCVPMYQPGVGSGESNLCEACGAGSTNDVLNPKVREGAAQLNEDFSVKTISSGICGNNECRHLGDCQYELGWDKEQQRYHGFCRPFVPKVSGDCRQCNHLSVPCTEDLCGKLGKNCQFLSYEGDDLADVNYVPGICIDMNEEDTLPLFLKLWDYPLDDYTFDKGIIEEGKLKGYSVTGVVDVDKLAREEKELRLGVVSNRQAGCFYYKDGLGEGDEDPFDNPEHRMSTDDKFRHYISLPLGQIFEISRENKNVVNIYCKIEESSSNGS